MKIMFFLKITISIFKDFFKLLIFFFKKDKFYKIIFLEDSNSYPYLYKLIQTNINRKKKILIFSLDKNISSLFNKDISILILEINFFREVFFLIQKSKYLISTTTDLDETFFRKSLYKKCKYIYIQHSHIGLINGYNEKAFINFDAVQVINTFQKNDLIEINEKFSKKIKKIKTKYHFIDFQKTNKNSSIKQNILIAPTWGTNFYEKNLHIKICKSLIELNYNIVFRPHPMTINREPDFLNELENLNININKDPYIYISNYKNLISDWSGIIFEFFIIKKKKSFCINTSKKINNLNFKDYKSIPIELELRNNISSNYEINDWKNIIRDIEEENIIDEKINKYFY